MTSFGDPQHQETTKKRFDEKKSQSFISKKCDTVISAIKDVKEHNEGVKSQIKEIKEDINKLGKDGFNVEVKLNELEQYARRDCLEITGILIVPNDSPALLVKEMSEIMGVDLNENDISIAHRLQPTKKVKDRLIVKFTRREKRDEIYSKIIIIIIIIITRIFIQDNLLNYS